MSAHSRLVRSSVILLVVLGWSTCLASLLNNMEPPLSAITGLVVMEETGEAIAGARVLVMPAGADSASPRVSERFSNESGEFHVRGLPVGEYRVSANSRVHELEQTRVRLEEGAGPLHLRLELAPRPSFLNMIVHQHVFRSNEPVEFVCHGFTRADSLRVARYAIDLPGITSDPSDSIQELVADVEQRGRVPYGRKHVQRLEDHEREVTSRTAEGDFHEKIQLSPMPPGAYLLTADADGIFQADYVVVTDLGLILKRAGRRLLAYAVNLSDGLPAPGVDITCLVDGEEAAAGRTNDWGLFSTELPAEEGGASLSVIGRRRGSAAFVSTWYYALEEGEQPRIYFYTDRPVYRPGDTVRYNLIARKRNGTDYVVPAGEDITVAVRDWRETRIHDLDTTTDHYGTVHGEFALNQEALTGYYTVTVQLGSYRYYDGFQVAEYRKPEYEVEVKPARERYTRGETAEVTVEARYYFGGPVVGATGSYDAYVSPLWEAWTPEDEGTSSEEEYYEEEYYEGEGSGELVASGPLKFDLEGRATFTLPTKKLGQEEQLEDGQRYRITVRVADPSGKYASGQGSFKVTAGEFYIRLRPTSYVAKAGQESQVKIVCNDYQEQPQSQLPIELVAERESWAAVEVQHEPVKAEKVTTNSNGSAVFRFVPPRDGYYRVRATATDRLGNRVTSLAYVWVTSETYADLAYKYPEIELIPDKELYEVGDVAKVLVNTNHAGSTALVTLEGPTLSRFWQQELKGKTTVVQVPIRADYIPNVYLSVCYVADKEFISQTRQLKVSPGSRKVNVSVTSDREQYAPGETAVYTVTTADSSGKPVRARVSLGVVDEAIYAIAEDPAPDIVDFFYSRRENEVQTEYSFPPIYLGDGDKAGGRVHVRKWFPDTAFWNPTLETDETGKAVVRVKVPDSLTTWRATARAHTLRTAVGAAVHKMRCAKEFMVRLEMPRFITQHDRLRLSGMVHNETDQGQRVELSLDAPSLNVSGSTTEKLTVLPGRPRRVDWQVEAPTIGQPTIRLTGVGENVSDAMELPIPILPHGRKHRTTQTGGTTDKARVNLEVRSDIIAGTAKLRVRFSSSLVSPLFSALEYLTSYPYGCTEQTMSAFLPDVVVAQALREMDKRDPKLEKRIGDMVTKGLSRLYRFQHDDGGWGWWEFDSSDLWMTSYVVFGLLTAKNAGYQLNQSVINAGVDCLRGLADHARKKQSWRKDELAFAAYVLALAGDEGNLADWLAGQAAYDAGPYALAFVVLALAEKGDEEAAANAMDFLWNQARQSSGMRYWPSSNDQYWRSDYETTAVALKAALAADSSDPRIQSAACWLIVNRQGGHWYSTRDTAWAVYALIDYVREFHELRPNYEYAVFLDSEQVATGTMTPQNAFQPEALVEIGPEKLPPGSRHVLEVKKRGEGTLYYTAELEQIVDLKGLATTVAGAGIVAQREYYRMAPTRVPASEAGYRRPYWAVYGEGATTETSQEAEVLRFLPSRQPQTRFRPGDFIRVRLVIRSPEQHDYMVIEEPLPAGCEVSVRRDVDRWEWDEWFSDVVVRDEKLAYFARELPEGENVIEYDLQAEIPGTFHVMPTEVYSMYDPNVHGAGEVSVIEVRE